MPTKLKRPRDPFQLAKLIGDISTGQVDDPKESVKATAGRMGGLKGGTSRANKLTATKRSEIAEFAATVRWKKTG